MDEIATTGGRPQQPDAPPDSWFAWIPKKEITVPLLIGLVVTAVLTVVVWIFPDTGKHIGEFLTDLPKLGWFLMILLAVGVVSTLALWRSRTLNQKTQELDKKIAEYDKLKRDMEMLTELLAEPNQKTHLGEKQDSSQANLPIVKEHPDVEKFHPKTPEGILVKKNLAQWVPFGKLEWGGWEEIKTIRYGHVEYAPFMRSPGGGLKPSGLGLTWLEKLLDPSNSKSVHLDSVGVERSWNDIVMGLADNDYDIVATPLFATFERSRLVRFTAPLFFSNIGLFVRSDRAKDSFWTDVRKSTLRKDLRERAGNIKFHYVRGEISEKLTLKYVDEAQKITPPPVKPGTRVILESIFDKIANSAEQPEAIFCESYFAENFDVVRQGRVTNALPWHLLLYPVCYAVRLGDHQLANLINIRMLDLIRRKGVLDELAEQLASAPEVHMSKENVIRHFVAEWPCNLPKQAASSQISDPTPKDNVHA